MSWFPPTSQIDQTQAPVPPNVAGRVMSQKAASMPAEPEEEQVLGLMEFTGLMREQAIRYLKVHPENHFCAGWSGAEELTRTATGKVQRCQRRCYCILRWRGHFKGGVGDAVG